MRVLVLGATGLCGGLVVRQFFKRYPDGTVVAYVRNPSKLPDDIASDPLVTVIQGELTDKDALCRAFESGGQIDAVLSAIGPVRPYSKDMPVTQAYATLIPVMSSHHCKRLVALSTVSHDDPRDKFSLTHWLIVTLVWLLVRDAYREIRSYSPLIVEECDKHDIDWTLVRVAVLTMKEGRELVMGYVGDGKVGITLSRHNLAEFFVQAVESKEWVRKAPAISSK